MIDWTGIIAILSIFIGLPGVVVAGIVGNRMILFKQKELRVRERELELEERRMNLLEDQTKIDQLKRFISEE